MFIGIGLSLTRGGGSRAAAVLVSDTFTRANSAVTMGSTEIGAKVWTPLGGTTWGITSNTAYRASAGTGYDNPVIVDAGASDCTVSVVVVTNPGDGHTPRLYFRMTDKDNGFFFQAESGIAVKIYKNEATALTEVGAAAVTDIGAGKTFSVVLNSNSIIAKLEGVTVITASNAFNQPATKHGFGGHENTARYDNFTVTVP